MKLPTGRPVKKAPDILWHASINTPIVKAQYSTSVRVRDPEKERDDEQFGELYLFHVTITLAQSYSTVEASQFADCFVLALPEEENTMPEKDLRPRNGAKAVAIDNRAQLARIRLLLFLSILFCAGLAVVLNILLSH
jgi:hypothetical protein